MEGIQPFRLAVMLQCCNDVNQIYWAATSACGAENSHLGHTISYVRCIYFGGVGVKALPLFGLEIGPVSTVFLCIDWANYPYPFEKAIANFGIL